VSVRRTVLTPGQAAERERGAIVVEPALWVDADGELHVDIPTLLMLAGMPNDVWHREQLAQVITEAILAGNPDATIVIQETES
jgi:hypothetical protein